jgi:P4 family phage/plasmid primase-like protien
MPDAAPRDPLLDDPALADLVGEEIDLQAVADELHAQHFASLPRIRCAWLPGSPQRGGGRLVYGLYRRQEGVASIHVSRRLRLTWVPLVVLRCTLYHEYCHHAQACDPTRKGERTHGKRFREEEARCPHYAIVRAWEKANQHLLADPTDRRMAVDIGTRLTAAPVADPAWIAANQPPKPAKPAKKPAVTAAGLSTDATPADFEGDDGEDPPSASAPPSGDPDDDPELRNELADADRFVRDVMGKAWYCPQRSSTQRAEVQTGWLVWDGKRLRPSEDGAILRLARLTALALSAEYLELAKSAKKDLDDELACEPIDKEAVKAAKAKLSRLLSRADQVQTENRMEVMVSLARIDERLLIDSRDLDAGSPIRADGTREYPGADLLNTPSGVVHLPTGLILPHDPIYRCTRITASPYLPGKGLENDPGLHRVLRRGLMQQRADGVWVPDPARIAYMQDTIGNALYGHQRLQKFYLCIGGGGDGKGTLFEGLLSSLGGGHDGYAMQAAAASFVRQKMAGHRVRDDLANMHKARVVLSAEINKGDALDGALVKSMFGETTQRVRELYGREFEFKPICTLFFQANHEPHVDAQDHAMWRRLVKVPWGPSLRDDERDPDVHAYICDPLRGGAALLAWAIEGAKRTALARAIPMPPSVAEATGAYRDTMNYLGGFLVEELRFSNAKMASSTWVAQAAIRPAIKAWFAEAQMEDDRAVPINGKTLGALMRSAGAFPGQTRMAGKNTKVWLGVTLRSDHPSWNDACAGSFVPKDELHHAQLAKAKSTAVVVETSATSPVGTPEAGAEKNATRAHVAISDTAPADLSTREVAEVSKKKEEEVKQEQKPWDLPDLDDIGESPF